MPQQLHRANLSSAVFPMTLAKAGRSVIVPGSDQNFDRRIDPAGISNAKAVGIPQAIYMENVLPTPDGFQSIGLKPQTGITTPGTIKALQQIYFATVRTTTTINPDVSITDSGNVLATQWITSPNRFDRLVGGASLGDAGSAATDGVNDVSYAEVAESTGVGNPVNSYRFSSTADKWPNLPCYAYRNCGIALGDPITVRCDIRFITGSGTQIGAAPLPLNKVFDLGVACGVDGAGLHLTYSSVDDIFYLKQSPGTNSWSGDSADAIGYTTLAVGVTTTPLAYATWYTAQVSLTGNADGSTTVVATIKNTALTVTFVSLTAVVASGAVVFGDYVGINARVPADFSSGASAYDPTAAAAPNKVYYDNFTITATIVDTSVTIFSGVNTIYIAYHSDNTCTWSYDLTTWDNNPVTEGTFTSPLNDSEVSFGSARGQGFICVRTGGNTKIYELSVTGGTTLVFTDRTAAIVATLSGFVANDILGITSSYNYLILYTASTIFWSSTTTPTDFAQSLVSGAGNEIPGNLKGDITFCREHLAGFFIYTAKNVVFAVYTGNSRYPWKFREVGGSSGYTYSTQVAGSTNAESQYGFTNSKYIQELVPANAGLIASEVTDFLSTQTHWDIFDSTTNTFSISSAGTLIDSAQPRIWFVLDRYVIVPYGFVSGKYTYALIYDVLLRRYGKLKATFNAIATDDTDFYTVDYATGAISKIYFDIYDQVITGGGQYKHSGVILLGKFQFVRSRLLQLDEIEIESTQATSILTPADQQFSTFILPSLDGKNFSTPVIPYKDTNSTGSWIHYLVPSVVGINHSIGIKGAFDINTLQLAFTPHGQE